MVVLNTAVAAQLTKFKNEVDALVEKGVKKDEALFQMIRKTYLESKRIVFEGDGYSEKWVEEAERRGLTNITNVPEALKYYASSEAKELFTKMNIFTEREVESRLDVMLEDYTMKVQIESRVLGDLALNHIVPIAVLYQNRLLENIHYLKNITDSYNDFQSLAGNRMNLIRDISAHIIEIKKSVNEMIEARKLANVIQDAYEKASAYSKEVFPFLDAIRYHIDKLELIVDDEIWPLPKYRELLFIS
jgi:glutamine synthetase